MLTIVKDNIYKVDFFKEDDLTVELKYSNVTEKVALFLIRGKHLFSLIGNDYENVLKMAISLFSEEKGLTHKDYFRKSFLKVYESFVTKRIFSVSCEDFKEKILDLNDKKEQKKIADECLDLLNKL